MADRGPRWTISGRRVVRGSAGALLDLRMHSKSAVLFTVVRISLTLQVVEFHHSSRPKY